MEAWRLQMKPWRVFRSVVADSHHFGEKALRWKEGSGSELKWCGSATLLNNKSNSFTAVYDHLPSTYIQVCLKANSCNFYAAKVTLVLANWGKFGQKSYGPQRYAFFECPRGPQKPRTDFFYNYKVTEIIEITEPVFVTFYGTQESIPSLAESIPGLHKRLQIRNLFSSVFMVHMLKCRYINKPIKKDCKSKHLKRQRHKIFFNQFPTCTYVHWIFENWHRYLWTFVCVVFELFYTILFGLYH